MTKYTCNLSIAIEKLSDSLQTAKRQQSLMALLILEWRTFASDTESSAEKWSKNAELLSRLNQTLRPVDNILSLEDPHFIAIIAALSDLDDLDHILGRIHTHLNLSQEAFSTLYFCIAIAVYPFDMDPSEKMLRNTQHFARKGITHKQSDIFLNPQLQSRVDIVKSTKKSIIMGLQSPPCQDSCHVHIIEKKKVTGGGKRVSNTALQ